MPDVKGTEPAPEGVNQPAPSQDVKAETVPYGRFKEINDKLKELEAEKAKRADDEKKSREDKMLQEKQYKELLDQRAKELEEAKAEQAKLAEIARRYQEQQDKIRAEALLKIADEDLRKLAEKLPDPADVLAFANKITTQRDAPYSGKGAPPEKDANPLKRRPNESFVDWSQRVDREIGTRK